MAIVAPVLAAKLLFSATAYSGDEPVTQPYSQNYMEFVAWNGERWTGWVRGDVFELRPQNQSDWHAHANTTLAFLDWEGNPVQAKIDEDSFALAHHGDWQGHIEHESAIRYRDWGGNNQIRTLAQLTR